MPFFIAVVITLYYRDTLYEIAQPVHFNLVIDWNLARISEAFASIIEFLPFLKKYNRQIKKQEYIPESVQGFVEMLFLYAGWLCWHFTTETYVAACIISFTVIIILLNIYQDAYQPKKTKA